jgi:hypothetical protein
MMYYIYWSGTQDVLYLPVKYIGCIILLVTYTGCIVSTSHVPECEVYQPMRFTDIFADVITIRHLHDRTPVSLAAYSLLIDVHWYLPN